MSEFSGDEVVASIFCGVLGAVCAFRWYAPLVTVASPGGDGRLRALLAVVPVACQVMLLVVLSRCAAREVRDDPGYLLLFMLGGAAWLGAAAGLSAALGVSARDDALERRNPAAAVAVSGALAGATLCYAGANIGEGATIWTTFGPALMATLAWGATWVAYEGLTGVTDGVAIDRDVASGWRLAGVLTATGLIAGRAVAGDYESVRRTLEDFAHQGWPALLIAGLAACIDRVCRPKDRRPRRAVVRDGVVPAMVYVFAAAAYVVWLGPWDHFSKGGHS